MGGARSPWGLFGACSSEQGDQWEEFWEVLWEEFHSVIVWFNFKNYNFLILRPF